MGSHFFDKLWKTVFAREGELFVYAAELARAHNITSAREAINLAKSLEKAGQAFFEYCDDVYKTQQLRVLERMRRRHKLSPYQVKIVKAFINKAAKGKW